MTAVHSRIRIAVNVALDGALAAVSVPVARWIADPSGAAFEPLWMLPLGAAALLLAGTPFRLSLQYWRFAGIGDLFTTAASAIGGAALFSLAIRLGGAGSANLAFPVVHALVLMVLLGAPRAVYRRMQALPNGRQPEADSTSILLIGESQDADLFLRALAQDRRQAFRVEGLLALSARQTGRRIQGYAILGTVADTGAVLDRLQAEGRLPGAIVIATPDLAGAPLAAVVEQADRYGLKLRRAPRPTALDQTATELRPVVIEDLLNRPQVPLDRDGMARLIQGRRVIVTGAGGTIGSELARQVAAFGPSALVLIDNGEYALWQIDMELGETHPHVGRQALIADIRDETRIRSVFEAVRPELVFHAAALKHVPMVEANPLEGLATNAVGTRHVADAARAVGALAMVLISTDKAVNPTSVMGASKRLAEMYCQALDVSARAARDPADAMRCITVRFGNVLGSTGSVVPLFQRQLARGGPLTVTHPDMQRYFMTVREAVGLVLQASVVGTSAEGLPPTGPVKPGLGGIFVLDMGVPIRIVDLARQMIRLAGLRPDHDVQIEYTGLRPGEKLYEELFHGQEPPVPTGYPGLLIAAPRTTELAAVGAAIERITALCQVGDPLALELVADLVPELTRHRPVTMDSAA